VTTLEVRDLTKVFHGGRAFLGRRRSADVRAVDGVSFTLSQGRTTALVGESGSGKSTIARILARLTVETAGTILLDGAVVARARQSRKLRSTYRRRVQMVFQDPFASLNPAHTVRHHLARPLRLHHKLRGDAAREGVEALLQRVNLMPPQQMAAKYPHEMSGGQRQRVAIARALAPEPQVLLADEPVSMLDVSIRLEILNLIADLQRERQLAVLYITHDLATARHFSDTVLVMYRGWIVESGPSDEVILNPKHPYTQLLAAAAPDPTRPRDVATEGRSTREAVPTVGCRFAPRCPFVMDRCRSEAPPDFAVGDEHAARCWLYTEQPVAQAAAE
jgi:peptide/nickel transport system ATP-binding protein